MTGLLFDLSIPSNMQRAPGVQTGRAVDAADQPDHSARASNDHAVDAERASSRSDANGVRRARGSEIPRIDALRIVQPKPGPFTEVQDGKVVRTYYLAEVSTQSWLFVFSDGEERQAPGWIDRYVSDGLHLATIVEVRA